ncbi:hypothetical protein V6N13_071109 [Hibiscus sabdariffa]|uniref:Uncharacterized protein n=1 Tax=Hibiscus sabdariffa TaxID=183260 RepID=A0ABR2TED6_9ROSI
MGACLWILSKSQAANVIKSEPEQHVLQINRLAESPGGEFQCGGPPLEEPRVSVGVEDALTEEIMEHGLPRGAFGIIVKTRHEDVLQIPRVARDRHERPYFRAKKGMAQMQVWYVPPQARRLSEIQSVLDQSRQTAQ